MTMPRFENYDDAKLTQAREAVEAEMLRRARQSSIPRQIIELADEWVAGGGKRSDLSLGTDADTAVSA